MLETTTPKSPLHASVRHDTTASTTGIDVSEFDKSIDWQQVQSAGVKFAFVRATDGTTIQTVHFPKTAGC